MAEELWHYLENQFDNSTKRSFLRAHAQGIFHQAALVNAPPAIGAALLARFNAGWNPFHTKYGEWQNLRGQLRGATLALEQSYEALEGEDIESIETDFKTAYKRGTPEYISAFPQGREPVQRGGQEVRKMALDALVTRMEQLLPPLVTAVQDAINANAPQAEIDAATRRSLGMQAALAVAAQRQASITTLRTQQNGLESGVTLASDTLGTLRASFTEALYLNMLQLAMGYTPAQRPQVEAFFDLELLQRHDAEEEEPEPVPPPAPPVP